MTLMTDPDPIDEALPILGALLCAIAISAFFVFLMGCTNPSDDDDDGSSTPTTSTPLPPTPTAASPTPEPTHPPLEACETPPPVPCMTLLAAYLANGGEPPPGCIPDATDGQADGPK